MPAPIRAVELHLTVELSVATIAEGLGMSEELVRDMWRLGVLDGQLDPELVAEWITAERGWNQCRQFKVGNGLM